MRARSALFTLFGDVVRPAGGEVWLTSLTGCMDALGFTPEATRTALHRMAAEDWVEPRRTGRYASYRLTARGEDRLEEAAARIYRLRDADWDGSWRLLVSPAIGRTPALTRALRWMGFGQLSADTWISPHPHGARLTAVMAEHDLSGAMHFVTDPGDEAPQRDREIVACAWDLEALHDAQEAFVRRWSDVAAPAGRREAFRVRIMLVHDWRAFLHLDPGLPHSLLPDEWLGDVAAARFREVYEAVEAPAWAYFEGLVTSAPAHVANGQHPALPRPVLSRSAALHDLTHLQARNTVTA